MRTWGFPKNLLCCCLLLGGTALLMAFIIYMHPPFLLTGLGFILLSVTASPALRKSFQAFALAMRDFPNKY